MSERRLNANLLTPVNELDFEREVLASAVPVLVDFKTAWCGPCRALAPILTELAAEHAGRVKVVSVDADESPLLASQFAIRGFPTVLAFVAGREVARQLGLTRKEKLLALLGEARHEAMTQPSGT